MLVFNECMCEKEEEQKEIIKLSLFVYTLEYTRPCASRKRAIGMYSRNKGVVCEQWYEYTTHTQHASRNTRERKKKEREKK